MSDVPQMSRWPYSTADLWSPGKIVSFSAKILAEIAKTVANYLR